MIQKSKYIEAENKLKAAEKQTAMFKQKMKELDDKLKAQKKLKHYVESHEHAIKKKY